MRAAALFAVLVLARAAILPGEEWTASAWSPFAYLWQDAAVAVAFALVEMTTARARWIAWALYAGAAGYVAATLPVMRVLGTPLTVPMWRAAGAALSDSIVYYATLSNLSWIVALGALAVAAPRLCRRVPAWMTAATLLPLVVIGPGATKRVDTRGLDRNAWSALALSSLPRMSAAASAGDDWRRPRADSGPLDDLSALRGAAAGRNIVFVVLESTAAQYLGAYGTTPDIAPNLTALARSGIVFENAYAVYPESVKGLFATLCSRYPAFDRAAERYARIPCRSAAALLAERGYHTALFHSGRFAYLGMDAVIRNRGYDVLEDAGDVGGERESSFGVDEHATVRRVLRWIDSVPRGDRFFVTYLPIAGHHPYESSGRGPFPDRDEFGRYRNAVHDGDVALGALVDGVRARGLDRDTVWVVAGDHGEAFGQHAANYGHTFQLYDENVRVPFAIAAPAIRGPIRSARVVSLLDVAPTIVDLAGLPPPAGYQGESALGGRRRMALFFADYSLGLLGLRDGRWKYVYEMEAGRSRLFDVERDPAEMRNLASVYPDVADRYAQHLGRWIQSTER